MTPPKPKIIFIQVKDNAAKLNKICATVQKHFELKESILITVPSAEAAVYIDQLLWRLPEESFLPHAVVHSPSQEMVAITTATANINQAKILLNLRSEAISFASEFLRIYELFDLTHFEKERLSLQRQAVYQSLGYKPEMT